MKYTYLLFLFFIVSINTYSQVEIRKDSLIFLTSDSVIICQNEFFRAFHSHTRCSGLQTCTDSLVAVPEREAIRNYGRKWCCICWEDVATDCVNDDPDYYFDDDENPYYENEEGDGSGEVAAAVIEELAWLSNAGAYSILFAVVGSVAFFSNEIYVGGSYAILPPNIALDPRSEVLPAIGVDLMVRKNIKQDAVEYGFNYHEFEIRDEIGNALISEYRQNFIFKLNYQHYLNRYFSSMKNPVARFKIYAGPILMIGTEGRSGQVGFNNQFGIGGTLVVGVPLGKRFHLDLRGESTNYYSGVSAGIRWMYQRRSRRQRG
ncbi:MAG: hypothetical protein AAF573_23280 [Bacteroidota bacterium]